MQFSKSIQATKGSIKLSCIILFNRRKITRGLKLLKLMESKLQKKT